MVNGLEYTKRVSLFGENLAMFGKSIFQLLIFFSIIFFWWIIFTYYQGYQEIAVSMIKIFRLSVIVWLVGLFLKHFFYSLNIIIFKRKMKKVELNTK